MSDCRPPMAAADLRDAASYLNPTDECDLVMKGGITSGLVYPLANCRLATRYEFRRVGGASAGAIGAGLTAAAEYQRRRARSAGVPSADSPVAGFPLLAGLPDELGRNLESLFQPSPRLTPAYRTLTAFIEPNRTIAGKVGAFLARLIASAPVVFVVVLVGALVPGLLIGLWLSGGDWGRAARSLLVWLPGALVLGLVVAAVVLAMGLMRELPRNGFGFVLGHAEEGHAGPSPLTDWLADKLDRIAGLAPGEGPLTFGHLYGEQASQEFRTLKLDESEAPESPIERRKFAPDIELQMMTACYSLRRPYVFPFTTKIFHYCPQCWARYFPEHVMQRLNGDAPEASPASRKVKGEDVPIDLHCRHHPSVTVRRLPPAPDIPVVIGIRLSLSFPGLISAVPFWVVDFTRAAAQRELIEIWFSDGGTTSNFPVHFFDTLLPARPTFGISLAETHPDYPDQLVWRPEDNRGGVLPRPHAITGVPAFFGALFATLMDWSDSMAATAPGFRDRIVEVRTRPGEGGLNLKMESTLIRELSDRGDDAAGTLESFDFDDHRWIRYRTALACLSETLAGLPAAYPDPYAAIADSRPGSTAYGLNADDFAATRAAVDELVATAAAWETAGYPTTRGKLPNPRPRLRTVLRE